MIPSRHLNQAKKHSTCEIPLVGEQLGESSGSLAEGGDDACVLAVDWVGGGLWRIHFWRWIGWAAIVQFFFGAGLGELVIVQYYFWRRIEWAGNSAVFFGGGLSGRGFFWRWIEWAGYSAVIFGDGLQSFTAKGLWLQGCEYLGGIPLMCRNGRVDKLIKSMVEPE